MTMNPWFSLIWALLSTPVVAQVVGSAPTVADPAWTIATQYGFPGLCLMGLYLIHRDQSKRADERMAELRRDSNAQVKEVLDRKDALVNQLCAQIATRLEASDKLIESLVEHFQNEKE